MNDQASDLRRITREAPRVFSVSDRARPRLVLVAGGKGGVGTSTLAVNLAVAWAEHNRRVVLVDADPHGGDVARLCSLDERATLDDVISGRRTAAEAIQSGPADIDVISGAWGSDTLVEPSLAALERLVAEVLSLAADQVAIDVGKGVGRLAMRLWRAADRVLLVITPDVASIMNGYATIKVLMAANAATPIDVVVNMAAVEVAAEQAFDRLAKACRRFLGIELRLAGTVPWDAEVGRAGNAGEPFTLAAPNCAAARQLRRLAKHSPEHTNERVLEELPRKLWETRKSSTVA